MYKIYYMKLPAKIEKTLQSLKGRYPHSVGIKLINGKCYVYQSRSIWDKETKKIRVIANYLGRILEDGTFVEARKRIGEEKTAVIITHEKRLVRRERKPGLEYESILHVSETELTVLQALSMNGRISMSGLAKLLDLRSGTGAQWQKRKAEKKFGIKYITEIDVARLGYLTFLTFIKFSETVPSAEVIKRVLENEPRIQLVALLSGKYDLLIYSLVKDVREVDDFIYRLQSLSELSKYPSAWYTTPNLVTLNLIPLRDGFFGLLEESVWKRSKENPRPERGQLSEREWLVLRELNNNGAINFTEIDKRYSLEKGGARYTYHKLLDKGIINRITITLTSLPIKYNGIILTDIIDGHLFEETRPSLLLEIISDSDGPINKYILVGDVDNPHGGVFIAPVFTEGGLQNCEESLGKTKGLRISTLVITDTIIGSFCYRRFDRTYTKQHQILVEKYKMLRQQPKIDYTNL